jgi:phosphate starvation-inducible PhoH-like protein
VSEAGTDVEKTLSVESRDELQGILGLYDENLKKIRKATGAEIVIRDGRIRIRGEKKKVAAAHSIFARLLELVRHQGEVTDEDLATLLEQPAEKPSRYKPIPGRIFRPVEGVQARSEGQQHYLDELDANDIVFSIGPAGTGKTFLAVAKAVEALKEGRVRKMILVRPAVEAGERLGFLPGDIQAKVNPYLRPIYDSLNTFLEFGQLGRLVESDVIEICPLAYMRGRTLDEAYIILDEAQNATSHQMKMFLTRMGRDSKVVVTGDITQIDLPRERISGLVEVQGLLKGIPGVSFVYLTRADIVRHPVVQRIVDSYEKGRKGKRK